MKNRIFDDPEEEYEEEDEAPRPPKLNVVLNAGGDDELNTIDTEPTDAPVHAKSAFRSHIARVVRNMYGEQGVVVEIVRAGPPAAESAAAAISFGDVDPELLCCSAE